VQECEARASASARARMKASESRPQLSEDAGESLVRGEGEVLTKRDTEVKDKVQSLKTRSES